MAPLVNGRIAIKANMIFHAMASLAEVVELALCATTGPGAGRETYRFGF